MLCRRNFPIKFSSTAAFTLSQIDDLLSTNYNRTDLLEYQFLGSFHHFTYLHNNFAGSEASVTHGFRKIGGICLILLIVSSAIKQKIISYNMTL